MEKPYPSIQLKDKWNIKVVFQVSHWTMQDLKKLKMLLTLSSFLLPMAIGLI